MTITMRIPRDRRRVALRRDFLRPRFLRRAMIYEIPDHHIEAGLQHGDQIAGNIIPENTGQAEPDLGHLPASKKNPGQCH